jgi:hypothetical protein
LKGSHFEYAKAVQIKPQNKKHPIREERINNALGRQPRIINMNWSANVQTANTGSDIILKLDVCNTD